MIISTPSAAMNRIIQVITLICLMGVLGCPSGSSFYYYVGPAPITASINATTSLTAGDIGSAAAVITGVTGELTYEWTITSPGVIVGNSNDLTVSFGSPDAGSVTLAVTVTDSGTGTSATSAVQINFQEATQPLPPLTANAGPDQTIAVGNTVLLLGSVSGGEPGHAFIWRQASGPVQDTKPEFTDNSGAITVVGTTPGIAVFELIVGDSAGASATDTVQVIVTALPG